MPSIFDVGSSALNSLQRAISTTGNNIANVNTDGYSRQLVEFSTRNPEYNGGFYLGSGVEVSSIHRAYDQFLTQDVRARTSTTGYYQLYANTASLVDDLMADPATSISAAMDEFFASMEAVANSPTTQPERQVMLSQAQTLAGRFNYVDARLSELAEDLNQRIEVFAVDINRHTSDIAQLNEQIRRIEMSAGGPANDLLDHRDRVIEELSALMRLDVQSQEDGTVNVFTASGHRLVSGGEAETLRISSAPQSDGPVSVYLSGPGGFETELTEFALGGELGASMDVATNVIDRARREIGLLALGLTETFNTQHSSGSTLEQEAGGDFFSAIEPTVTTNILNSGTTTASAAIDDVTALTGASYEVEYTSTGIVVTNLSTNQSQEVVGDNISIEGVTITVTAFDAAAEGDRFLIEPTARAASAIAVELTDTSGIAAASVGAGIGDNSNIMALIALRDANNLKSGQQSIYDIYNNSVSNVAVETRSSKANAETEASLLQSVTDRRQGIVGVNLEEEAANLIKYQQAYQAAAQVIAVANDAFDTLMRAASR